MVKYKVLGNVKIHKASPVAGKKLATPIANASSTTPKGGVIHKPPDSSKTPPTTKPQLKDIGNKYDIVKFMPGRPPGRPMKNTSSSVTKKASPLQGVMLRTLPAKTDQPGRPRKPGSRLSKPDDKATADVSSVSTGVTQSSVASTEVTSNKGVSPPSERTVSSSKRPVGDGEVCLTNEPDGKTPRKKRRSAQSVSDRTNAGRNGAPAIEEDSDQSDHSYIAKTSSPRVKKKHKHKRKKMVKIKVESVPERRSPRKRRPVRREPMYLDEVKFCLFQRDEDGACFTHWTVI